MDRLNTTHCLDDNRYVSGFPAESGFLLLAGKNDRSPTRRRVGRFRPFAIASGFNSTAEIGLIPASVQHAKASAAAAVSGGPAAASEPAQESSRRSRRLNPD
jgi:hypothetical protein